MDDEKRSEGVAFRPTHRHHKDGLYQLLGYGTHTETKEAVAVYRDSSGGIWVRPQEMFDDGRFRRLLSDGHLPTTPSVDGTGMSGTGDPPPCRELPALAQRLDDRATDLETRLTMPMSEIGWLVADVEVRVRRQVATTIREVLDLPASGDGA
jgi:hypothetical protein